MFGGSLGFFIVCTVHTLVFDDFLFTWIWNFMELQQMSHLGTEFPIILSYLQATYLLRFPPSEILKSFPWQFTCYVTKHFDTCSLF